MQFTFLGFIVGLVVLTENLASPYFAMGKEIPSKTIVIVSDDGHGVAQMIENEITDLTVFNNRNSNVSKCLFLEVDVSFNPYINSYMNGEKDYKESIDVAITTMNTQTGMRFENVIPENLLRLARSLGYKVYGDDVSVTSSLGKEALKLKAEGDELDAQHKLYPSLLIRKIAKIAIETRSNRIATQVDSAFRRQECGAGMVVIGAAHTGSSYQKVPITPIQSYLGNLGYDMSIW